MKQLLKIWILVAAMVMGGALPPQVMGDNSITTQWSAQAKSKKKDKKKKKSKKSRESRKKDKFSSSLLTVPTIGKTATATVIPQQNTNALLSVGIPKGVSNQVINYQAIRVNFNPSLRIPNCVAYELTATMVSMADAPDHESRKNYNYAKDSGVKSCPENWEYRGSGYSRGHMAPAMDMRWDKTAMAQCFYMTNMCPQDTKLNNDHWRVLEEKVHRWAKRDKRLMVYTGPIIGKNPKKIGKDKQNIAVPDAFFKVVTVAEVERRTGLTFSSAIPKRQCKVEDWE